MLMSKYAKFITAAIGAGVAICAELGVDEAWVTIAVTFLTAIGVYVVPNATDFERQARLQRDLDIAANVRAIAEEG
jgi:hypothetical protein